MTGVFLFLFPNFNLSLSSFSQLAMQKYFFYQIACALAYVWRHVTSALVSRCNGVIYCVFGIPELHHTSPGNWRRSIRINTAALISIERDSTEGQLSQEQPKLHPPGRGPAKGHRMKPHTRRWEYQKIRDRTPPMLLETRHPQHRPAPSPDKRPHTRPEVAATHLVKCKGWIVFNMLTACT